MLTTAESPRWLIAHGKKEQALHNLNRLRNKQDVASGYTAMEIDALETLILDESSHHEGRWIDLVGKRYIWRTMVCDFMAAQPLQAATLT